MKYFVYGGNSLQKHIVEQTVDYIAPKLKLTRYPSLAIEYRIKKINSSYHGFCSAETESHSVYKPRFFDVELSKDLHLLDFVKTICHETIHVKQYVTGEIREDYSVNNAKWVWKSRNVSLSTSYLDHPWEKEAFRKEGKLAMEVLANVEFSLRLKLRNKRGVKNGK